MRKFLSILLLACLSITKAAAYEWTDANGVKWFFDRNSFTINGESQQLWRIYGAENFNKDLNFPETVYNGNEAITKIAILYFKDGGCALAYPPPSYF